MEMTRLSEILPDEARLTSIEPVDVVSASTKTDDLLSCLQRDHLQTRCSSHAEQDDLWLGVTWLLPPHRNARDVADALTRVAQRHESFQSWFESTSEGFRRHTADPLRLSFHPAATETVDDARTEVPARLRAACSPFSPFGYTVILVETPQETRLVFAMDHAYGDAQSLLIVCEELHRLLLDAQSPLDLPAAGYSRLAVREREIAQTLSADHAAVQAWADFLQRIAPASDLGAFPGWQDASATPAPVEPHHFSFADEEQTNQLEAHAAADGLTLISVLYGALALAARDVAGAEHFRFVNPIQLREADEISSVGWYTGLVPMHVDVSAQDSLKSVGQRIRADFSRLRTSAKVPFLECYRIVGDSLAQEITSWNGRFMLSYLDTRMFCHDLDEKPDGLALVSEAGEDVNVSAWIFRGVDGLEVLVVAPRRDDAALAIQALFKRARRHVHDFA